MKFVVNPVTDISRPPFSIEEGALAFKRVILEVSLVIYSIRVNQSSITILETMLHHSLEMTVVLISLHHESTPILLLGLQLILAKWISVCIIGRLENGLTIFRLELGVRSVMRTGDLFDA